MYQRGIRAAYLKEENYYLCRQIRKDLGCRKNSVAQHYEREHLDGKIKKSIGCPPLIPQKGGWAQMAKKKKTITHAEAKVEKTRAEASKIKAEGKALVLKELKPLLLAALLLLAIFAAAFRGTDFQAFANAISAMAPVAPLQLQQP